MLKTRRQQAGFTALELLIACSLLALLGLSASLVLNSSLNTEQKIKQKSSAVQQLDRALLILQRDLQQAVPRANRPVQGSGASQALWGWSQGQLKDGVLLEFVRHAPDSAQPEVSRLERVRYRLQNQVLVRETLLEAKVLSQESEVWHSRYLLADITDIRFSYLLEEWMSSWSVLPGDRDLLPLALRLNLDTKGLSGLEFVFMTGAEDA